MCFDMLPTLRQEPAHEVVELAEPRSLAGSKRTGNRSLELASLRRPARPGDATASYELGESRCCLTKRRHARECVVERVKIVLISVQVEDRNDGKNLLETRIKLRRAQHSTMIAVASVYRR